MAHGYAGSPMTLDLTRLSLAHAVDDSAHHWVSDRSIGIELLQLLVGLTEPDDLRKSHNEQTHRARRIASVVLLMATGTVFDPLAIRVADGRVLLRDGHHRLRAYQYLGRLRSIPVVAVGALAEIRHAEVQP